MKSEITLNFTKVLALLSLIALTAVSLVLKDASVFIAGLPVVGGMVAARDVWGKEKKGVANG